MVWRTRTHEARVALDVLVTSSLNESELEGCCDGNTQSFPQYTQFVPSSGTAQSMRNTYCVSFLFTSLAY